MGPCPSQPSQPIGLAQQLMGLPMGLLSLSKDQMAYGPAHRAGWAGPGAGPASPWEPAPGPWALGKGLLSWFLRLGRPIWASQGWPQGPPGRALGRPIWALGQAHMAQLEAYFMVPQAGEPNLGLPGLAQEASNRPQKGPILGPILRAQITLSFDWEPKSLLKKGLPGGPK